MDTSILEIVFETLESILQSSREKWGLQSDLVKDLKVDSDDLSFIFVPEVEKKAEVRIPVEEWSRVSTIQEVVTLIEKYKLTSHDHRFGRLQKDGQIIFLQNDSQRTKRRSMPIVTLFAQKLG
jgi:acyl carrier protein